MKRRISILLIAALLLTGIGCGSIGGAVHYANADQYAAGAMSYRADAVTAVDLNWSTGSVTLKHGGDVLNVYESGGDSLNDKDRLHWWLDGSTLRIHYCAAGHITTAGKDKKNLTLELPEGVDLDIEIASGKVLSDGALTLGEFRLDTASGGAELSDLAASDIRIDAASGKISLGTVSVSGECKVDTASGGLEIDRISAHSIRVDSVSGGVRIGLDSAEKLEIDAVSGGIGLKLFDTARGARIAFDSISGDIDCKLPCEKDGSTYKIGLGAIRIDIDSVSGDVTVE